jgi:hypothetical protein
MVLTKSDKNLITGLIDNLLDEKLAEHRQGIKSDMYDILDPLLRELIKIKENQEIIIPKNYDLQEKVEILEEIHPQGKHV